MYHVSAQESLSQQERILGRGYEEVLASLRQCAGQYPVPTAAGGDAFGDVVAAWGTPEILGRLEAMRMLLMQADRCVCLSDSLVLVELFATNGCCSCKLTDAMPLCKR